MADRRSGEVEREDNDQFSIAPCPSFVGAGHYCDECSWSRASHEEATERGRDVQDEREGQRR